MAAPTIIGPLNQLVLTPAANRVAYQLSSAGQVLKTNPGLCISLICVGAGAIALWDASVSNTTSYTTTAAGVTGTVTNGYLSATNQFYTNSSMTVGQTVGLSVPCAAGIVGSGGGNFNVLFA